MIEVVIFKHLNDGSINPATTAGVLVPFFGIITHINQ